MTKRFLVKGDEISCMATSCSDAVETAFKILCVESEIYATTVNDLWIKAKEKFRVNNPDKEEETEDGFSVFQGSSGDYESLKLTMSDRDITLTYDHTWDEWAGAANETETYKVSIIDLQEDLSDIKQLNNLFNGLKNNNEEEV